MVTCSADIIMKRILLRVLLPLLLVWLVATVGLYAAMRQSPDAFGNVMKHVPMPLMLVLPFESLWNRARGGVVEVGEAAPDFTLPTLDHQSQLRLSSFRGSRPVALVFGSYT
jgi:hypothetical protein